MASVDTQAGKADEAVVEVAKTVSPEVKVAAAQAVLSESGVEISEVLRDHRGETLALVQKLLASAGIEVTFSMPQADQPDKMQVALSELAKAETAAEAPAEVNVAQELSPEDVARTLTLSTLEARFKANANLHEGCDWSRVETALKAHPRALLSINQMEAQGHVPDVYNFDDRGFDIGTCSEETPASARNCVYDAEAAKWLKENHPDVEFNGSAVEMAEAMGIKLMSPAQYREGLQTKGKFDKQTWSYLLTDEATRKAGVALGGRRRNDNVYVIQDFADFLNVNRAWRGSLRVLWN